jgi:hypothetical protein
LAREGGAVVTRTIEIDNCEIYAWAFGAVFDGVSGGSVHHNLIHHNQRNAERIECAVNFAFHGAGYGVEADPGETRIVANVFHHNRHCIASTGRPGTVYEAYFNVVLPPNVSHSFDAHGGIDRVDGTYIAADTIVIAYNTFLDSDHDAVNVRGQPVTGAWVFRNELINDASSVVQTKIPVVCDGADCHFDYERMYSYDNRTHASYSEAFLKGLGAPESSP